MTSFDKRSISASKTLGDRLRQIREQSGVSLDKAAADLRIKAEYLDAIERSKYTELPSRVFVKNYVRNYAKYLRVSLNTTDQLLEEELKVYEADPDIPTVQRHYTKKPLQVVHIVVASLILLVILLIAAYFITEVTNIAQPPELQLDPVPAQVEIDERFVSISGSTDIEATVTINNQPVDIDADGTFSQVMGLQEGLNLFRVVAKTKRSKERIEYKQIIVESADTEEASTINETNSN